MITSLSKELDLMYKLINKLKYIALQSVTVDSVHLQYRSKVTGQVRVMIRVRPLGATLHASNEPRELSQ